MAQNPDPISMQENPLILYGLIKLNPRPHFLKHLESA